MRDRLAVGGQTLEIRWWRRSANRTPLVLLHEGLGSVALWRDFPQQLADATERSVFAYSRLGHGWSDPPPARLTTRFMHDEAMQTLPAVLDAAGIGPAVLLGHSDGGSIALMFAATYPSRTAALVLEAPHVFVEDLSIASIARMKDVFATTDLAERMRKYHAAPEIAFRGWNDVWLDPEFRQWNLESFLPQVIAPTLLIQGEQDEYGTLRQVEAIERGVRGPIETLVLGDCGHSPHRDQTARVISAIAAFLRRVPQSRSTAE